MPLESEIEVKRKKRRVQLTTIKPLSDEMQRPRRVALVTVAPPSTNHSKTLNATDLDEDFEDISDGNEELALKRMDEYLEATGPAIGRTNKRRRKSMSKDQLLKRNMEIQREIVRLDEQYSQILDSADNPNNTTWEGDIARIDRENDNLASEQDAIEAILEKKFSIRGGGRFLVSDVVVHARKQGALNGKVAAPELLARIDPMKRIIEDKKNERLKMSEAKESKEIIEILSSENEEDDDEEEDEDDEDEDVDEDEDEDEDEDAYEDASVDNDIIGKLQSERKDIITRGKYSVDSIMMESAGLTYGKTSSSGKKLIRPPFSGRLYPLPIQSERWGETYFPLTPAGFCGKCDSCINPSYKLISSSDEKVTIKKCRRKCVNPHREQQSPQTAAKNTARDQNPKSLKVTNLNWEQVGLEEAGRNDSEHQKLNSPIFRASSSKSRKRLKISLDGQTVCTSQLTKKRKRDLAVSVRESARSMSKSQAAVLENLDRETKLRDIRRAARAEERKNMLLGQLQRVADLKEKEIIREESKRMKASRNAKKRMKKKRKREQRNMISIPKEYPYCIGFIVLEAAAEAGLELKIGGQTEVELRFVSNQCEVFSKSLELSDEKRLAFAVGTSKGTRTYLGALKTLVLLRVLSTHSTLIRAATNSYLLKINLLLVSNAFTSPVFRSTASRSGFYTILQSILKQRELYNAQIGSTSSIQNQVFPQLPPVPTRSRNTVQNVRELYEELRPKGWTVKEESPIGLTASLLPYQKRALAWMLHRERRSNGELPNPFWIHVRSMETQNLPNNKRGTDIYFSRWGGVILRDDPNNTDEYSAKAIEDVRGGILAEEMGLGKTVEMIALMLKNRITKKELEHSPAEYLNAAIIEEEHEKELLKSLEYIKIHRPSRKPRKAIGTTLVVTPIGILHQWLRELKTHAPHLDVMVYEGLDKKTRVNLLKEQENRSDSHYRVVDSEEDDLNLQSGHEFEDFDVVLTTYQTLAKEVNYSKSTPYLFRRRKRYKIPETPLMTARFWRMVLDEAQEVESTVKKCALMASRISAVNRWCVTGTPIGRQGLEDLHGLIQFLRINPLGYSQSWLFGLQEPYLDGHKGPLLRILRKIMWRHSKIHIKSELKLPSLKEEVLMLEFSPIEEEAYKVVLDKVRGRVFVQARENKLKDGIEALEALEPLRLACCNPGFRISHKKVMTLSTFGRVICRDAQDKLENAVRDLCRHYNKLGQLYQILYKPSKALQLFQECYRLEDEGFEKVDKKADEKINIVTRNDLWYKWAKVELFTRHHMRRAFSRKILNDLKEPKSILIRCENKEIYGPFPLPPEIVTNDSRVVLNLLMRRCNIKRLHIKKIENLEPVGSSIRYSRIFARGDDLSGEPLESIEEDHGEMFANVINDEGSIHRNREDRKLVETLEDSSILDRNTETVKPILIVWVDFQMRNNLIALEKEPWKLWKRGKEKWLEGKDNQTLEHLNEVQRWELKKMDKMTGMLEAVFEKVQDQVDLIDTYKRNVIPNFFHSGVADEVRKIAKSLIPEQYIDSPPQEYPRWSPSDAIRYWEKTKSVKDEYHSSNLSKEERVEWLKQKAKIADSVKLNREIINKSKRIQLLKRKPRPKELIDLTGNAGEPPKTPTRKKKGMMDAIKKSPPKMKANEKNKLLADIERLDREFKLKRAAVARVHNVFQLIKAISEMRKFLDRYAALSHNTHRLIEKVCEEIRAKVDLKAYSSNEENKKTFAPKQGRPVMKIVDKDRVKPNTIFTRSFKRKTRELKKYKDKLLPEEKEIDFNNVVERSIVFKQWQYYSDSINVLKICKLLLTVEDNRLRKAHSAHKAQHTRNNNDCEQTDVLHFVHRATTKQIEQREKALQKEIKLKYTECESLSGRLRFLRSRFGIESRVRIEKRGSNSHAKRECPICKAEFNNPAVAPCGHQFCFDCVNDWLKRKKCCPQCRKKLRIEELVIIKDDTKQELKNATIDTKIVSGWIAGRKNEWTLPVVDGEGEYGVKVETLVAYILDIDAKESGAKSLIFSHFPGSLNMVAEGLKKNKVEFVHLKGSSKNRADGIERFKTNPKVKTMLISLRSDSSGLTLVAATHVFLLEPSFNFAVEQQAINRVHRIGQDRPCTVHRLVIKDTIEEKIFEKVGKHQKVISGKTSSKLSKKEVKYNKKINEYKGEEKEQLHLLRRTSESLKVKELLRVLGIDPQGV
eukprot:CAMPEP_0167750646 /NCGR_PEP_ID=MMETSP0110_2-20121227/6110_1 /TAXON_ID=629695 /ORGANISM="Gymnochlora sp., Strain CCMP2014" /LENGTH=2188 /DNA_ID=CAMNT_0007635997 /DNA_START=92 /DNA_END=6658 /DNA_ORIENTATION=-